MGARPARRWSYEKETRKVPVPKRYFHCSRDINDDPEVRELCNRFGLSGLRLWLEVLASIDKTENEWHLSGDYIGSLSFKVGCKPGTTRQALQFMEGKNWLRCEVLPDNNMVYMCPKYWRYHKRREPKTDMSGSPPILSVPSLPFPKKEEDSGGVPVDVVHPSNGKRGPRRGSPPLLREGKESVQDYVKRIADRMTMSAAEPE